MIAIELEETAMQGAVVRTRGHSGAGTRSDRTLTSRGKQSLAAQPGGHGLETVMSITLASSSDAS